MAALAPYEERVQFNGQTVIVRELECAADMGVFEDKQDSNWKLLVRSVFDENGEPVFTDADIPMLKRRSLRKMAPLVDVIQRVNGMDLEARTKKLPANPDAA